MFNDNFSLKPLKLPKIKPCFYFISTSEMFFESLKLLHLPLPKTNQHVSSSMEIKCVSNYLIRLMRALEILVENLHPDIYRYIHTTHTYTRKLS